jgi:hypothetical protein
MDFLKFHFLIKFQKKIDPCPEYGAQQFTAWPPASQHATPSNRHTEYHVQAMQFLAAGHKIRIGFLRNAERIQKNSDEI